MADYSSIKGNRVQYLSTDPTLDSNSEGQVWYNSTTSSLKGLVQIKAASSGGSLSTARRNLGGAGTQTAALAFGGFVTASSNATEEYSGFSWSNGGNLNQARQIANASTGTQTAGLGVGGYNPPGGTNNVEEYDGSSWTNATAFPVSIYVQAGAGIQTSSIFFGGSVTPGFTKTNVTQEYNGTSWTAGGNLSLARDNLAGSGTLTAGLAIGGRDPASAATDSTEEYNGTSWTAGGNLPAVKKDLATAGIQTLSTAFGGENSGTTYFDTIEEYDGSSWTASSATLGTARLSMGSGGSTGSSSLVFGGMTGSNSSATEEYNSNIIGGFRAVWNSGGNMGTGRGALAGAGTQTSALAFGGATFPPLTRRTETEEYNGSSWSEQNNLGTARNELGGCGTQTAGLGFGGYQGPQTGNTEEYNGTSWSEQNNLNTARYGAAPFGIQTAAVAAAGLATPAGFPPNGQATRVEEYNGSSWTEVTDVSTFRFSVAGAGTQTAGVIFGGNLDPGSTNLTEEYDGTSWTSGGNLNNARSITAGAGIQTAAIAMGGSPGSFNEAQTELYDGSVWSSTNPLTSSGGGKAGGTASPNSSSIVFGGIWTNTATEEFTGSTLAISSSDLTTS